MPDKLVLAYLRCLMAIMMIAMVMNAYDGDGDRDDDDDDDDDYGDYDEDVFWGAAVG